MYEAAILIPKMLSELISLTVDRISPGRYPMRPKTRGGSLLNTKNWIYFLNRLYPLPVHNEKSQRPLCTDATL